MGIPVLIIGVAGGMASGKTTVVEAILDRVGVNGQIVFDQALVVLQAQASSAGIYKSIYNLFTRFFIELFIGLYRLAKT